MNKKFKIYEFIGIIFTVISGSLLHFLYEWSGKNPIVGLISPINESTWEHLKLLFIPMLFFSFIEYFLIGKNYPNYIVGKAAGIFTGIIGIITIFYTYTGIIGKNLLPIDILTFIIGVISAYIVSLKITLKNSTLPRFFNITSIFFIVILAFLFIIFTIYPPHINLFIDPITKTYN